MDQIPALKPAAKTVSCSACAKLQDLSEREILALAISLEEEDGPRVRRLCRRTARNLSRYRGPVRRYGRRGSGHRASLIANRIRRALRRTFPLIRPAGRQGPSVQRPSVLADPFLEDCGSAYAGRDHGIGDAPVSIKKRSASHRCRRSQLLGDLRSRAQAQITAEAWKRRSRQCREKEDEAQRRLFVLQIVQPVWPD